jgi:glycosyltransferase involved in cell wall biosynthesis
MSKQLLISFIIPCYNAGNYLKYCIDSILNQDINDFEIILVNDGSTDNTLAICKKYSDKYKNINVVSISNSGVSTARNKGLNIASGKYVMFIDSDDLLAENSLKYVMKECDNDRELIIFDILEVDENGFEIKKNEIFGEKDCTIPKEKIYKEIISGYKMNSVCNKVFKKSLISMYGLSFNFEIHYGEDLLFVMEYCTHISSANYLNRSVYCYRRNTSSATHIFNPKKSLNFYVNEKMYDFLDLWGCNNSENKLLLDNRSVNVIYQSVVNPFFSLNLYQESILKFIRKISNDEFVETLLQRLNLSNFNLRKRFVIKMIKKKRIRLLFVFFKVYVSFKVFGKFLNSIVRSQNEKKTSAD